jgi:hypothetical protein
MTSGLAAQADEITRQNATTNPSANPIFFIFPPSSDDVVRPLHQAMKSIPKTPLKRKKKTERKRHGVVKDNLQWARRR